MKIVKLISLTLAAIVLTACHPFGTSNLETPSPLPTFTPTAQVQELWSESVGNGTNSLGLRFAIGYSDGLLYTTDAGGDVQATDAKTGDKVWNVSVGEDVTSGASAGNGIVIVGTDMGHAIALDAKTGQQKWDADVGNQMLAPAQIANNIVILKTVADTLIALDASSGRQLWNFVNDAPTLILRLGSTPQIAGNNVYVGFASGRLSALGLQMGDILWQQQIALPRGANAVQQMVDIDADPVLQSDRLYTATYQGNIAALGLSDGRTIWSHSISTYTGLVADQSAVYVTDAKGYVWAFSASDGRVIWRQKKLRARVLTAPSLMANYIVVADAEGYLHWIDTQTGQFAARAMVADNEVISSQPLVVGNQVFVLTDAGHLKAYQLGK